MLRFMLAATIGIALGSLVGVLTTGVTKGAEIYVSVYQHGGPSSISINCGWHSACVSPYTSGSALDWQNSGNAAIYWRSYNFRSDTSNGTIGTGNIASNNGTCKGIRVDVYDIFGFTKGAIQYTHSQLSQQYSSFGIFGGWGGPWQELQIGRTASTEFSSCVNQGLWSGPHLHQTRGATWWEVTGPYPSASSCHTSGCWVGPHTSPGYQQFEQHWCWFCP
jgi:hypothetical protein